MARESVTRVLLVAAAVALSCSVLVSGAVYVLRPLQAAYAEIDRNRAIAVTAGRVQDDASEREVVAAFLELDVLELEETAVYVVPGNGRVIVPFAGQGMWSTIEGYVGLEADLDTIAAVTVFKHGETPGIGDRIEDPQWLASWAGKRVFDDEGRAVLTVVKRADGRHQVDLISGASVTSEALGRIVTDAVARVAPEARVRTAP